jgi:galactose mutarotase-like enzyme
MITIENEYLNIQIKEKGAELCSIVHKQFALEYMWSGDAAYWGKTSPVLFPIVGTLKNNTYFFNGKAYELPRHGFVRESMFTVEKQTHDSACFLLEHNANTLKVYPFAFAFRIHYTLQKNTLTVTYDVKNIDVQTLYFSVGAHPAFKIPLVNSTSYNDYQLVFNKNEHAPKWPISSEGLIEEAPIPFFENNNTIPLYKALFYKDALVFKNIQSSTISIQSVKTNHGFDFSIQGFPYLGIWAAKEANFICIEPWCGIADSVNHNQELTQKEGIIALAYYIVLVILVVAQASRGTRILLGLNYYSNFSINAFNTFSFFQGNICLAPKIVSLLTCLAFFNLLIP